MTTNCLNVQNPAQVLTCQYEKNSTESQERVTFQTIARAKYSKLKMRCRPTAWIYNIQRRADVPIWQTLIGIKRTLNIPNNRTGKVLPTKDATTANCLNVKNSACCCVSMAHPTEDAMTANRLKIQNSPQVLTCQYEQNYSESKEGSTFHTIARAKYS